MKHEPRYYRKRPENDHQARPIGEIVKPILDGIYRKAGFKK